MIVLGAAPPATGPLDVNADGVPDTEAVEAVRRQVVHDVKLDRTRGEFDFAEAERAEAQREMNVLRDMALEQQKRDDEALKKWIALI